ncbi:hypothetical protein [Burkholderia territorii]|nr:hypothetical protein [Burkholderia territorii]MBM2776273.1 hypothetical protein [Burkholderia territorii]TXG29079.1 hypothetical protein FU139_00840 [Burkholderia territorii]HDR8861879.1 hypothetical protein [Burkholderia territorii]HDR8868013.1 hypothetical protein [Burkholderia territorii]HDR8874212.1 hypothetical protein [Burkholderia territorii]
MKTFARSGPVGRTVGTFIVLQGEFWPNGIYAGISEVAYAAQDLSVNRVGIFPTKRIEREQTAGRMMREFVDDALAHGKNPAEGVPARLPGNESVKIIVVFHDSATILVAISLCVSAPFLSGFSRISRCNKP